MLMQVNHLFHPSASHATLERQMQVSWTMMAMNDTGCKARLTGVLSKTAQGMCTDQANLLATICDKVPLYQEYAATYHSRLT